MRWYGTEMVKAVVSLCIMLTGSILAWVLTPQIRLADAIGVPNLENSIPRQFGEWQEQTAGIVQIVSAEQAAWLDKIYKELLSRVYVNSRGQQIMLSVSYGDNQRDGLSLHYPEVCYPSQGFTLQSKRIESLSVPLGVIPVRRLETVFENRRYEPITYWTMIGEKAVLGAVPKKLAEIEYAFRNQKVDAILFRVSSINADSALAFQLHDDFISDLTSSLDEKSLKRLAGLSKNRDAAWSVGDDERVLSGVEAPAD